MSLWFQLRQVIVPMEAADRLVGTVPSWLAKMTRSVLMLGIQGIVAEQLAKGGLFPAG